MDTEPSQQQSIHPSELNAPVDPSTSSARMRVPRAESQLTTSSELATINDRVTAPFDYTEGYHFLMKHLRAR
jgi:hypothetical protein